MLECVVLECRIGVGCVCVESVGVCSVVVEFLWWNVLG